MVDMADPVPCSSAIATDAVAAEEHLFLACIAAYEITRTRSSSCPGS